jgi:hypothetical protein
MKRILPAKRLIQYILTLFAALFVVMFFEYIDSATKITNFRYWIIPVCAFVGLCIYTVTNRSWGICISTEVLVNYGDYIRFARRAQDSHPDCIKVTITNIKAVAFKEKSVLHGNQFDLVGKEALILMLEDSSCKYIDLSFYTKRQAIIIMHLIEDLIDRTNLTA